MQTQSLENTTSDKGGYLSYNSSDFDLVRSNWSILNATSNESTERQVPGLPNEMKFGDQNVITVAAYTVLLIIAASGNLTVFITLCRNKVQKPRINLYILHLSVADLFVTFIMMPLEIVWNLTVDWRAGDVACRILMFFRIFGLYLSSFVLVVISIDRCFAILHPMSLNDADRRGRMMLAVAWLFSVVVSIPQVNFYDVFSVNIRTPGPEVKTKQNKKQNKKQTKKKKKKKKKSAKKKNKNTNKLLFMLNSAEHEIFTADEFSYLLAEKITCSAMFSKKEFAIVSKLRFISRTIFILSWVEHEKRFPTSGPDLHICTCTVFVLKCDWICLTVFWDVQNSSRTHTYVILTPLNPTFI